MSRRLSNIGDAYDQAASAYARKFLRELDFKPLDCRLLTQFANRFCEQENHIVLDVGCGTGQTTGFLSAEGVNVIGVDLSAGMLREAATAFPGVRFEQGDMVSLSYAPESIDGILAFYCIVHSRPEELHEVIDEFRRVLRQNGLLLMAFHVGLGTVSESDFLGSGAKLDFYFHSAEHVSELLGSAGFSIVEQTIREPYSSEYPSQRCYLLAQS